MISVGFEPTSTNTAELESAPLDRSGTISLYNTVLIYLNRNYFTS
jgi:hypothetical protein